MNRTDRLVAMVMYLQGRRLVRACELAEHFSVTERTIYRDMAALGESGVPISGEAGVGYSLLKGYHLPPVMFTSEEAAALFVGGEMVKKFTDASLHAPVTAALDKLRAVLPREHQDQMERLVRQTVIVGRATGLAKGQQPMLLPVQQAVVQRRVLRLAYHGRQRDAETARDVEPLGVVFQDGAWYLVAWCRLRSDLRQFRVDRIRRLGWPAPFLVVGYVLFVKGARLDGRAGWFYAFQRLCAEVLLALELLDRRLSADGSKGTGAG